MLIDFLDISNSTLLSIKKMLDLFTFIGILLYITGVSFSIPTEEN